MGSLCMKFHDDRCKGKAIMRHKPFSLINALWHWPLNPKTHRAYPQLMESLCMKFHDDRCKGKATMRHNYFYLSMHCDLDLWTPKSIGYILDSWGVFVGSFIMISVKGKQLCARIIFPDLAIFSYQCIVTLTFDLLTRNSLSHILNSLGVCM